MGDEEQQFDEEREVSTEEVESGKKLGFLPAIVFQILKWVLLIVGGIILVVTISVITFNLLFKGKTPENQQVSSQAYQDNKTIYEVFTNIDTIRGSTADQPSKAYLATVTLHYAKEKVTTQAELVARTQDIHNLIFIYLSNRTGEQLSSKYFLEIQDALTERINDIMIDKIEAVKIHELSVF
jgi:flagellar FliL protein